MTKRVSLNTLADNAAYWKVIKFLLEYQRIAESHFQHTESTFSSDTRQSMKRRIIAKQLTKPK